MKIPQVVKTLESNLLSPKSRSIYLNYQTKIIWNIPSSEANISSDILVIPAFYGTPQVHNRVQNSPPPVPVLRQNNQF
jgi:hypothetical protein